MKIEKSELVRRAQGALVGAAVGDSMGAPCEGMSAEQIRTTYGRLNDFVDETSGGTDDTDFTLFNAHLLLTYGTQITPEQVEAQWREKLLGGEHYYRPGGFSDVLATNNLREGMHAPQSGSFNHEMWSDGVAMSISAAGVVAPGKPEVAAGFADTLGSVSNARDGIYTARAVAAAISLAMVGASPAQMVDAAIDVVPRDSWTYRRMILAKGIASAGLSEAELTATIDEQLILSWWPWADLASEAVPVAFAFFLAYDGAYRQVVPASIAIGRDADTIGAIVGSMAGAYQGVDGIPQEWRDRVHVSQGQSIGFVANKAIMDTGEELGNLAYDAQEGQND